MEKRKKLIFTMSLCAIMAGLSIVLDKVSINLGTMKITFYALPLIVVGVVNGLLPGFLAGLISGTVLQLTSPYGITLSSPFWALAPIAWGTISGFVKFIFDKKKINNYPVLVGVAVVLASISANLLNTLAFFMDSLLVKDSYYTTAVILTNWPPRLIIMLVSIVPYIIISLSAAEALNRSVFSEIEEEEEKEEKPNKLVKYMYASFYLSILAFAIGVFLTIDTWINIKPGVNLDKKQYVWIFIIINILFSLVSLILSIIFRKKITLEKKEAKINTASIIISSFALLITIASLVYFIILNFFTSYDA